jgi:hypothetical protein
MKRTNLSDLDTATQWLNDISGNPRTHWNDNGDDTNPGHYFVQGWSGGVALLQVTNERGGTRQVLQLTSKKNLLDQIRAYTDGYEHARRDAIRREFVLSLQPIHLIQEKSDENR